MTDSYALEEVAEEMKAQFAKWGEQNHPSGADNKAYKYDLAFYRKKNDAAVSSNSLTWALVLLEEVYEALSEEDPGKLRGELVQVAAVACSWIEALDRKAK